MPQSIANSVVSVTQSPLLLMLIVIVIYFILGCFLDILAIVILTIPIFYPILIHAGWDPILTGVIVVVMMMLGSLTPPFGINVYAIRGVVKDVPLFKIFEGTIPFIGAFVCLIVLLLFFPQIATFLPSVMMGK